MPDDQKNPRNQDKQIDIMHSIVDTLYEADFNDGQMLMILRMIENMCDKGCSSWLHISALDSGTSDGGFEFAMLSPNMLEIPALIEGVQILLDQYIYGRKGGEV